MNEIFEKNLDNIADSTALAIIATGVPETDEVIRSINDVILANVRKMFKDKQGVVFNIEEHEVPQAYLTAAVSRVIYLTQFANITQLIGAVLNKD